LKKHLIIALFFCFVKLISAQTYELRGFVKDFKKSQPLMGATIVATSENDSLFFKGTSADSLGNFILSGFPSGKYQLKFSSIGYKTLIQEIEVWSADKNLGPFFLDEDDNMLDQLDVKTRIVRMEVKGDTIEFNANAYKLTPDAVLEDLLKKLPGVTIDGGKIMANGQEVKKITVDGKDFFGDDVAIALKNLPADMIDKVQLHDKEEDASTQVGAEQEKNINIVTKEGMKKGYFGRVSAGYGTENRYLSDGNINFFNEKRRISILGLSNNVNMQDFEYGDVVGALGGQSGRWNEGVSDFMTWNNTPGIVKTNNVGINYSENFSPKIKLTASYFMNNRNSNNEQLTNREFFVSENSSQNYVETAVSKQKNSNNTLNSNLEIKPDSTFKINYRIRANFGSNFGENQREGSLSESDFSINRTQNESYSASRNMNISNDLNFSKSMKKKNRGFNVFLKGGYNQNESRNNLISENIFYINDSTQFIDQQTLSNNSGYFFNSRSTYSEPLGKNGKISIGYVNAINWNESNRITNQFNYLSNQFSIEDPLQSNIFDTRITKHNPTLSYSWHTKKLRFWAGGEMENAYLEGTQSYPVDAVTNQYFLSYLRNAGFSYRPKPTFGLNFYYYTNAGLPSIDQLQNVVNNANPLFLRTGNPTLGRSFTDNIAVHSNMYNDKNSHSLNYHFSYSITSDYIGNSTFLALQDTIVNGIALARGTQLSMPTNFDKAQRFNSNISYSFPIDTIGTNFYVGTYANYSEFPALVNDQLNLNKNSVAGFWAGFGTNFSENFEISFDYSFAANNTRNNLQAERNNNFTNHNFSTEINLITKMGLTLELEGDYMIRNGLSAEFERTFFLVNGSVGYKFLKDRKGELKLGTYDLMRQNNSINRSVNAFYIEDVRSLVVTRFFYLRFVYQIKEFKKG
jgi:hypothetical protein